MEAIQKPKEVQVRLVITCLASAVEARRLKLRRLKNAYPSEVHDAGPTQCSKHSRVGRAYAKDRHTRRVVEFVMQILSGL